MTFSLIFPVYNVAPYLRECLDSILAQTFPSWECICVDDGSTDGSAAILDEYVACDRRFRVIHQENRGVSAARNAALDVASGDWLWFVDGDDMVHPQALEILSRHIDGNDNAPLDVIRFDYLTAERFPSAGWPDLDMESHYSVEPTPQVVRWFCVGAGMAIYRRTSIQPFRFENFRHNEDGVFCMRCMWAGKGWMRIGAKLYFYRQHEGSAYHSALSWPMVEMTFKSFLRMVEEVIHGAEKFGCDCRLLLGDIHASMYFTYQMAYFRLSAKDRARLLNQWIALQERMMPLYPMPKEWRLRIALVKFFHSGLLVKPIILCGKDVRKAVGRLLRRVGWR